MKLAGWILSGLLALFLFWDAFGKITRVAAVVTGSAQMGYSADLLPTIGIALVISTIIFLIPRLLFFGSILLTAYLGGAVATGVRAHGPMFVIVFPIVFAILVWVAACLRNQRIRQLL